MQFWGSGLHYFPNYLSQTLSFLSLCSFLLLPVEEGLGYECRAALPCVGYGGQAGMAQPQLAARRNSGDTEVLMEERKVLRDFCHKFPSKTISEGSLSLSNTLDGLLMEKK